jgi:hypothetical protein
MDAELIELSSLGAENVLDQLTAQTTEKFGGGIELLMNSDTKAKSDNKTGFDDIQNLENELNNLVMDDNQNISSSSSVRFADSIPSPSPLPEVNTTWDGYTKVASTHQYQEPKTISMNNSSSSSSSNSSNSSSQPLTKEDILREKFKFLRKLEALEGKGITLTKKYSMDSPLAEMQGEYEMIMEEKSKQNSVKFQSNMLMAVINGVEFLNGKFDPFDIKLDGWSEQINENLQDYDDVFGELHEKYKNKATLAPEVKLMFQLAGSALMVHMTNTMFKSSMPAMDDILRQNPDLMQQFQNAAVKSMSDNSPGFAGFMNNVAAPQQRNNTFDNDFQEGYRPGNNNNNFPKRPEMKGPGQDISDLLSGLKTRTIHVEERNPPPPSSSSSSSLPASFSLPNSNNNSSISLSDAKELTGEIKKSRRRNRSDKNTVSLDL